MSEKMSVARTILQQLGGGRFTAMTGARRFLAIDDGLRFALPARFAKDRINLVTIKLNAQDTYDVEFGSVYRKTYSVIREYEGIYDDGLQATFTEATGLETRL